MPELLFEIFCEEIPARMQPRAAADLERLLVERLVAAGLEAGPGRTLAGPRRLAVVLEGLAARSPDVREERKGPRVDPPEKSVEGFLRGAGLSSLDQCETRSDKKGDHYVALIERKGRPTADILAEAIPDLMRAFPWPKSMRWGSQHDKQGGLRWVRPIHRIVCLFDGAVVPFEVAGIVSGDQTEGHRLLGRGPFKVTSFEDYFRTLTDEGAVVLDASERRARILKDAQHVCSAEKLELVEDEWLLEEVTGLVEHPVVLLGRMDPDFLDLPPEVVQLTMRTHQKYFAVRHPTKKGYSGKLAPHFVVVANQTAPDGGKAIAAGNARVLSARLNDARYFWDKDRNTPLAEMAEGLKDIVFHQKLGAVADKVHRMAALARELAPLVGADPDLAERAAHLAKADLVSEMVGEFPELQGVMGRYYAKEWGEPDAVADAIRDHYRPQGPADHVPREPVAVAVALADKLDTLVGFWAIDEKPTGSKDPYALRRAALGVIRILLANDIHLSLFKTTHGHVEGRQFEEIARSGAFMSGALLHHLLRPAADLRCVGGIDLDAMAARSTELLGDLMAFLADRLKVHLRDEGHRHDLVDAVFAPKPDGSVEDDLVLVVKRVNALGRFLDTDDGGQLLAAHRRASNILRDEEKKDAVSYAGTPDRSLLAEPEETALHDDLGAARAKVESALAAEDFEAAMAALAPLRPAIDAFFEKVLVNAEDAAVRRNRLMLLSQFRDALSGVADFSKIAGDRA